MGQSAELDPEAGFGPGAGGDGEKRRQVERSLTKRFRKEIWSPFIAAVKRYELIGAGDRIAVCISGGKDSMLLAKLLQMLQRFSEVPFELTYLVMDPGYRPENRRQIQDNAALLGLPITVFSSDIFAVTDTVEGNPCYLCARMRRGNLYARARDLGCNKIALGHHFSDVIETTVMAMFYGGQLQAMIPKLHSRNFPGMELIRPLYCVHEDAVIAWARYNGLSFIRCACRLTERIGRSADGIGDSKRQEIKELLRRLKRDNPNIEKSIFRSLHAVHLDTFPGYKTEGKDHSFLERYGAEGNSYETDTIGKERKVSVERSGIGTKCVQAGYTPGNGEPRQIPIVQSTTFKYDTSEDMGKLFDLEAPGYFYTRLQNPTNDYVAAKIAALEGGTAGMLTSSGQAANFLALFNICECGSHIVASSSIYGGTFNLIGVTMRKMGIEVTFVAPDASEEELHAAFRDNTRAMFGETIANPALTVLDIEKFARIAHAHGVPLIVDNTFPTPVHCRPIEWGADIVTHSTTKYMDGHGTAVGGAIVDSGRFDWMAHADKFPGLTTPDESYHGITYAEKFGLEGAFITKCTAQLMRDFGCIQSPQHAFYLNLGLESLHVRMKRHAENGQAVAEFLASRPEVERVHFSGLPGDPYHAMAEKYLPEGGCGVVSFELKGGRAAAEAFMKRLKLAAIETHVADARTCCLNPATSTHRQLSEEQLAAAGVPAGLVRMSCGLEDAADLIADLAQALEG